MYTVVIIEDDPMITRLNRRYVEQDSRFAVVQTFSAAHPALFWLQRNPIDLIILDVYMPQMSGTELLMQLRAKGVDADVIMVTSANDAKTVNDAVRLGAVDYLVKPFSQQEVGDALDRCLEQQRERLRCLQVLSGWTQREIPLQTLEYIEIRGHQAQLHAGEQVVVARRGLDELETEIGSALCRGTGLRRE